MQKEYRLIVNNIGDWMSVAKLHEIYGWNELMLRKWGQKHPEHFRKNPNAATNATPYLRVSAVNAAFDDGSVFGD